MPTLIINFTNSCNTLNVSEETRLTDVKSFYRALAMKYHPFLNLPTLQAEKQFKTIDVACEELPIAKLSRSKVIASDMTQNSATQQAEAATQQANQAEMHAIFIDALLGNSWA